MMRTVAGTKASTVDVLGTLRTPEYLDDPYRLYSSLREGPPVRLPTGELCLSRYADVAEALKSPNFGKPSFPRQPLKAGRVLFRMFLLLDPPDHTRLRRVVVPAFSPSNIAAMRDTIAGVAERLLPKDAATFDLVSEFAYPLPFAVIGELLDIPREDRERVAAWSRTLTASLDSPPPVRLRDVARTARDAAMRRSHPVAAIRAGMHMVRYAGERLAVASKRPASELLQRLVAARADGVVNEDEAVATWILMAIAGHETTANLIGNSVLALLDHPDRLEQVCRDPTLIGPAVEECLRYDSPVPYTPRFARRATELSDVVIGRDEMVIALIASANRDPEAFPNPDQLELDRPATPPHLGFAAGIHFCVGAILARLETEIALTTLLPRLTKSQTRDALVRRPSVAVRGLERFPLRLTAQSA